MGEKLSKSEFMALYINDYYRKRFLKKQLSREGDNYAISRIADEKNKKEKAKKRGYNI
jgi:hypothetical protein